MNEPDKSKIVDNRSEVMRARLMDATLDVILEEGWSGASTLKICKRADVSRGAQTHHFPTKTSLFMAAVDKVSRDYQKQLSAGMEQLPAEKRSLRAVLEVLWESSLDDRFFHSSIEALVAARTDPELREPIAALDDEVIESLRSTVTGIHKPDGSKEMLQDMIEISLFLFRGMVVQRGIHDDPKYKRRLFDVWCNILESALQDF